MKRILIIGLGGTIVCSSSDEGLVPRYSLDYLLSMEPKIREIADVQAIQLMNKTIIYPSDWTEIAELIKKSYSAFDGFVITMGTDSLAYTSSMLAFMLKGIQKPVVLTGAMFSIENYNSDAKKNLIDSISFVCKDALGVYVVFAGRVITGCRASKTATDRINSFESVNSSYVVETNRIRISTSGDQKKIKESLVLKTKINEKVILVKLNPQLTEKYFSLLADYDGIVIEGYGDGNISDNLIKPILELINAKKLVVIASQCPYGKVYHKYRGGFLLIKAGAISSGDMTKEAVIAKLMWCLGQTRNLNLAKKLMQSNLCGEMSE